MTITKDTIDLATDSPHDTSAYSGRPDEIRRHELGAFLRSRRARIGPEQVGLPAGGRRRTPGLRREEVTPMSASTS
jgi:hypothetical protein